MATGVETTTEYLCKTKSLPLALQETTAKVFHMCGYRAHVITPAQQLHSYYPNTDTQSAVSSLLLRVLGHLTHSTSNGRGNPFILDLL